MNETGYSWPEAILTLAIMMLVFGTLLPLSFRMMIGLEGKKLEMRAKETMYQGAILYKTYGLEAGVRVEDGESFSWRVEGQGVCVTFEGKYRKEEVCSS